MFFFCLRVKKKWSKANSPNYVLENKLIENILILAGCLTISPILFQLYQVIRNPALNFHKSKISLRRKSDAFVRIQQQFSFKKINYAKDIFFEKKCNENFYIIKYVT